MAESRTEKVILNSTVTLLCQIVYLVVSFICRTIFTKTLGAEYLGVSGLFANILTILSFAELGIGSALVYRMYEPLANKNEEKVSQYIQLYKKIYRIIIAAVAFFGIAFIPAIPYMVEAPEVKENLTLLYILYLLQTLVTYVYVYKKSILMADQKNYIVNVYSQVFNIGMNLAQCVFLVFTHNFVIYCVLNIMFNLANNIVCSYRADKEYPYLKSVSNSKLSKEEIAGLFTDVKGLLLTKIAGTAFSGTDNIFISIYIGIRYVGIVSNYTLFTVIVNSVIGKIFDSITASIGNLAALGEQAKAETVLNKMFFLNTSLYGYMCLGLFFLLREFVTTIWLNAEYDLPQLVIGLMLLELFLRSIHYPLYTTRNAFGHFSEYKGIFAAAAALNILLDFLLVKPMGLAGLYIATIVCRTITYIVDIWVVYQIEFRKSIWNYIKKDLEWLLFLAGSGVIIELVLNPIAISGIAGFTMRCGAFTVVYFALYYIVFRRNIEFKYFLALATQIINKQRKRDS